MSVKQNKDSIHLWFKTTAGTSNGRLFTSFPTQQNSAFLGHDDTVYPSQDTSKATVLVAALAEIVRLQLESLTQNC